MKLNNIFRAENVKDISDQIHRFGKYAGNDYEFDDKDFLAKGQKKKNVVNPMNTINASKQVSNISPPSATGGRETLNEDQMDSLKTSQRVIDERDTQHKDNADN